MSLTLAALLGAVNTVQAADDMKGAVSTPDNMKDAVSTDSMVQAAIESEAKDTTIGTENKDIQNVKVNLANGEKIFKQGKGEVPACNSCHGPDGMGDDNLGTPRLAGQDLVYLIKELEDFAHDRRKDLTMMVMNFNAKGLSPQDRVDVASYVNRLPVVHKELSNLKQLKANGKTVGSTYLGKAIVLYGVPEKNVPACQSCHQFNGRGAPPMYPQIGLQKYVYLTNQLKYWRTGSSDPSKGRANDPLAQMRHVADKLSDDDIANVASYLITAPRTTMGNTFTPESPIPVSFHSH
ncbi:MAG: c-type cytochrome [Gammaproteobacteria bacterium]